MVSLYRHTPVFETLIRRGVHPTLMLLAGLFFLPFVLASLVNVTIDDKFDDPQTGIQLVYLPPGAWNNGTKSCSGCIAHVDPSQLYNGTWHESTFNPQPSNNGSKSSQIQTASVAFNGSALYVYCAIAHSSDGYSDMTFFIDGELVGSFSQPPSTGSQPDYQYHVPVYVNHSMPAALHTFALQNGHIGGQKSLVLLDSIIYTYDNGKQESTSASVSAAHSRRTVLLGSILGTLLGLLFVIVGTYIFVLCHRRRRRRVAPSQKYVPDQFISKWFDESSTSPDLQGSARNIFDLTHDLTLVTPTQMPKSTAIIKSNPEPPLAFFAHYSCSETSRPGTWTDATTSLTRSTSHLSASHQAPPLIPGRRTLMVVNL